MPPSETSDGVDGEPPQVFARQRCGVCGRHLPSRVPLQALPCRGRELITQAEAGLSPNQRPAALSLHVRIAVACGRPRAQGKGIVIETEDSKKIKRKEEDLNGVNPFYAILGAGGAAAMSFGSWKVRISIGKRASTLFHSLLFGGGERTQTCKVVALTWLEHAAAFVRE